MATLAEEKLHLFTKAQVAFNLNSTPQNIKIVAEGDSWFDYPLNKDVVDYLIKKGYAVSKWSKAGDELENMAYNTVSLSNVLSSVRLLKPKFVILSAGGNDVVGKEMIHYLNHVNSGLDLFRKEIFTLAMNTAVKAAIERIIENIWNVNTETQVIMHGYDYAKPTGERYDIFGIGITGPWILPAFNKKGIDDRATQDSIIKEMVDIYNSVLITLEDTYPNFHHLDLRGQFPNDSEWDNEIHLKSNGFKQVSEKYHKKIVEILGNNPLSNLIA
jgi:hypothetical protein